MRGKKLSHRKSCLEHHTDAVVELEKSLELLKESESDEARDLRAELESSKQSYQNAIYSLEVESTSDHDSAPIEPELDGKFYCHKAPEQICTNIGVSLTG